jgi:two-component system, OmpR family, alkaline phosphatase synthesis response regulator PhoP
MAHRILIVEDERPLAHALELKLKGAGFEVEVATDGQAGVQKLKDSKFDLVFLDLIMPKMDGFKALEEIRKDGHNVKVVVLSNLGQQEDMVKAKKLGASDYFVKADTPLATIVERATKILE